MSSTSIGVTFTQTAPTGPSPRERPQRGLPHVLGPLGRAFLKPRPLAVVDYFSPVTRTEQGRHPLSSGSATGPVLAARRGSWRLWSLDLRELSGRSLGAEHFPAVGRGGFAG